MVSYRQGAVADEWDVIVIGSGLGGLATASLLAQAAGKRVLVLEKHYTAGGMTHVFRRPGYEWDVGLHYVGQIEEQGGVGDMFRAVSRDGIAWAKMPETYDRVFLGEDSYDLVRGGQAFKDSLARRFPGSEGALGEYLGTVLAATKSFTPFFVERALPRRLGALVGPILRAPSRRWRASTVAEIVRPIVRDSRLFDVVTAQWGDYGLLPSEASFAIHAMVVSHYLRGAHYPVGGAGVIADSITRVIEDAGGLVVVRAEVAEIVVEGGRARGVRMSDGRVLRAPVIVSDAGARNTWDRLVPADAPGAAGMRRRVASIAPSIAHLCLHLGMRKTAAELGLDGTNLWIYPEPDRERAMREYMRNPDAPLPGIYISFPSAKDPTFEARYPGRSTIEAITFASPDWLREWRDTRWHKRGAAYEDWKSRMTERLLDVVLAHRPSLRGHLDHVELSTPLSTAHFTGHPSGEIYGLAHTPARFALDLRAETPTPGLYFTGQDLVSCGIGGALSGGFLCAGAILAREPRAVIGSVIRGRRAPRERDHSQGSIVRPTASSSMSASKGG